MMKNVWLKFLDWYAHILCITINSASILICQYVYVRTQQEIESCSCKYFYMLCAFYSCLFKKTLLTLFQLRSENWWSRRWSLTVKRTQKFQAIRWSKSSSKLRKVSDMNSFQIKAEEPQKIPVMKMLEIDPCWNTKAVTRNQEMITMSSR